MKRVKENPTLQPRNNVLKFLINKCFKNMQKNTSIHFIARPFKFKQQSYSKEMPALRIGDIHINLKSLLLLVKDTSFCFFNAYKVATNFYFLKELEPNFSGKLQGHAGEPTYKSYVQYCTTFTPLLHL